MTTVAIMQPTYLPWIGYFDLICQSDVFVFLDSVQFSKRSWQQRNRIKSAHGVQMLTVPVLSKGKYKQRIQEVMIDLKSDFKQMHIRSIQHAYSKSRYFNRYFDSYVSILNKNHVRLIDLNMDLIHWISKELGIQCQFLKSSDLNAKGAKSQLLLNLCKTLQAKRYISAEGSSHYLDSCDDFSREGIEVYYQNYQPKEYTQLWGEFEAYFSAIDLLMNEGPNSLNILTCGRKEMVSHRANRFKILGVEQCRS